MYAPGRANHRMAGIPARGRSRSELNEVPAVFRQHAVDSYRAPPGTSGSASPVKGRRDSPGAPEISAQEGQAAQRGGWEGLGPRGGRAGPPRTAIRPRVLQRGRERTKDFDRVIVRPSRELTFSRLSGPPVAGVRPVSVFPQNTNGRAPPPAPPVVVRPGGRQAERIGRHSPRGSSCPRQPLTEELGPLPLGEQVWGGDHPAPGLLRSLESLWFDKLTAGRIDGAPPVESEKAASRPRPPAPRPGSG